MWRKGTTNFHAVALQPPGSRYLAMPGKGGSVPCYNEWKKGRCKGRKQESNLNQEGGPTFRVITAYYFLLIENSLLHQSKVGPGGHR